MEYKYRVENLKSFYRRISGVYAIRGMGIIDDEEARGRIEQFYFAFKNELLEFSLAISDFYLEDGDSPQEDIERACMTLERLNASYNFENNGELTII